MVDEIKEESDYIVEKESAETVIKNVVENIIVVHEERAADIPESNAQSQQGKAITAVSFIKYLNAISFYQTSSDIYFVCIYSFAVNPCGN